MFIYIKKYYYNPKKINTKKKLLIDIKNLDKMILINKIKSSKTIDNFPFFFNRNIDIFSYIFNKLLLVMQIMENIVKNINKFVII